MPFKNRFYFSDKLLAHRETVGFCFFNFECWKYILAAFGEAVTTVKTRIVWGNSARTAIELLSSKE
ncbi:MAG: arylamine N-acetyltransferase [Neolewinella sp.]|jgi:arylamine N-acetyltransferase